VATFGRTDTSGDDSTFGENFKGVTSFTLSEAGNVNKLSFYVSAAGSARVARGIIYSDNAGSPDGLLAVGSEVAIADSAPLAWYDSFVSPPVVLTPGVFWLGWFLGGGVIHYVTPGDQLRKYKAEGYVAIPETPFGAITGEDNFGLTVYATYTPVGAQQLQPLRGGTGLW